MSRALAKLGIGALTALVCLIAPAAEATSQAEFLPGPIVPGKSIGPLRLGMSEQAARRALRKLDRGKRLVKHIRKGMPTEYLEETYPYLFTAYTLGYQGRPGKRRVVLVITHVDENKTSKGVGVSIAEAKLLRAYRSLRCTRIANNVDRRTECLLGSRSRPHTFFVLDSGQSGLVGRPDRPLQIMRVVVREPFERF